MNCAVMFVFLGMALMAVANPAEPQPPQVGGTVQKNLIEKNFTVNDFLQLLDESGKINQWCTLSSREAVCDFPSSNDSKIRECWGIFKPRFTKEFSDKKCPRNDSLVESLYDDLPFSINCTQLVNSTTAWELKVTNETLGKESLIRCREEVIPTTTTSTSTEPSTIPSTTPTPISTPQETKATEKNVTVVPAVSAETGDGHLYWSLPLIAVVLIAMAFGGYAMYRKSKQGGYRRSSPMQKSGETIKPASSVATASDAV